MHDVIVAMVERDGVDFEDDMVWRRRQRNGSIDGFEKWCCRGRRDAEGLDVD